MKSLLIGLLLFSSGLKADSAFGYKYVLPSSIKMGDFISPPSPGVTGDASGNTPMYFAKFLSGTTVAMGAFTGVTGSASISLPTYLKPGTSVAWGITAMYAGVTNSAVLSATASVQGTSYPDNVGSTTTAVQAFTPVKLDQASYYSNFSDIQLGNITGCYAGNTVDVFWNRTTGTNSIIYIKRVWFKYLCNKAGGGPD